jgi:uncharacterized membrane protein YvlD (DUF360 family)
MRFVVRWLATALAVIVAALLSGTGIDSWGALLGVAFFVGIANALARPLLLRVVPHGIVPTLIVAILAINLALLGGLKWLPTLNVPSLGNGLAAALIVTVVSCVFSLFFRDSQGQVHLVNHHPVVKRAAGTVE